MRKNILWKSAFISYLFILIIPLFVATLIYNESYNRLTENLYQENKKLVDNCSEIIDIEILNIDTIVKYFSLNPEINTYLTLSEDAFINSAEYYKVIKASFPIHSFPINQTILDDLQIYSKVNNSIISSTRVHTELEREYGSFLDWKEYSFDDWETSVLNKYFYKSFLPEVSIKAEDGHFKCVIPYITSVPFKSRNYSKGNIIAFIDLAKFQSILGRVNRGEVGKTFIFDENNNIITSVGEIDDSIDIISLLNNGKTNIETRNINGEDYFITQNTSDNSGFKIISILPTSYIDNQLGYIKQIGIVVLLLTLISGLLLSLYFSYKRTSPIVEIAKIAKVNLEENTKKINTFDLIRENLKSLIEDNKSLSEYREKQIVQNKNLFLERLLQGTLPVSTDINQQLDFFKLKLASSYFNVMIINILGYGKLETEELLIEKELIQLIILDKLEQDSDFEGLSFMHDNNQIVYILTKDMKGKLENSIKTLIKKLDEESNIKVLISLGNPCDSLSNISFSYGQANYALQYLKKNLVIKYISYSQLKEYKELVYYPLEIENKIILLTLQGFTDQVQSLYDLIYKENFENKALPITLKMQVVSNYLGTLTRIISRSEKSNICLFEVHQQLKTYSEIEDKLNYLRSLIIQISEENNKLNENCDQELKDKFTTYIQNHFSEYTLNISELAEKFNYKETFIYHFFINNLNISFASYLENIRMDKAKQLLLETDLSINDIAQQCGYSSSHSFRRAFKRVTSITPSDYKNN